MSWKCSFCESFNSDEKIICEVCDSISPFLAKFNYEYIGNNKAVIEWQAENARKVIACFNSKKYDITNWKAARISLNEALSLVSIFVINEVTERTYTFGIPKI